MNKKKPLSDEQMAECASAMKLFLAKKNQLGLSQKKLAEAAGITPVAVNLYLNGTNPLNAKFASVLAKAIGEPIERFSPRLAREIESLVVETEQSRRSKKYQLASESHRKAVDEVVKHLLSLSEEDAARVSQAISILFPLSDK